MQERQQPRSASGAKAIALDQKVLVARYRLYLFVSILLTAAFALGLHIIFGR
ncbi:MAG TPA: hypothetical protein VL461_13795 [Dictyobacter sp.]|jgi:hypothetical protein|nr:hypothetical protein [Dictyobacter sp.]